MTEVEKIAHYHGSDGREYRVVDTSEWPPALKVRREKRPLKGSGGEWTTDERWRYEL